MGILPFLSYHFFKYRFFYMPLGLTSCLYTTRKNCSVPIETQSKKALKMPFVISLQSCNQNRRTVFPGPCSTKSCHNVIQSSCYNHDRQTAFHQCELLITIRTGEWLFTSVNFNMQFQITTLFERLVTIRRFD